MSELALITTTEGEMVIEFWPDVAPKTVENFKTLAQKGFYDGTCFHRVIKGFMIQGGDPLTKDASQGKSLGHRRSRLPDQGRVQRPLAPARRHLHGALDNPDSAGSQFFICDGDASFLDRQYTAFGKLIKGDDVLAKIANTPVAPAVPANRASRRSASASSASKSSRATREMIL